MKSKIKKLLPKKILGRFIIIFFLPLICIQILAIFLFYDRHWEKITTRFANIASNQVNLIVSNFLNTSVVNEQLSKSLNIKTKIVSSDYFLTKKERSSFVSNNIVNTFKTRIKYNHKLFFEKEKIFIILELNQKFLEITFPKKYLISETPIILFLWIIFSSIILSLISFLFMRIQVRAISRLAKFSEDFGSGIDSKNFKPEGALEVRQAGNAFLKMKKSINNQIKNRTQLLAGISHDLGTIITRIKLQIELANKVRDIEEIKEDVQAMQNILSEYLEFSENIDTSERLKNIKLYSFMNKIINSTRRSFVDNKVYFSCEKSLEIKSQPNNLYRVISNIINNACKFSKETKVSVKKESKFLKICIEDDGPGISKKIKYKIFKPFFKKDIARNLNHVGSGLGLSIAKDITVKLGGRIVVEDSVDLGGANFIIFLPLR
tara:strand:- start:926 stop:2227 length:1302 start_codon:yes stop_codon:yes gene_type:complete